MAGIDQMVRTLRGAEGEEPHAISRAAGTGMGDPNTEPNMGSGLKLSNSGKLSRPIPYPHCGLYCIYSLLGLAERPVEFGDLIKPEYLGYREGSSLGELRRVAIDHGLYAEFATRLSTEGLRQCPYKGILHVRIHPESSEYNHYELFLGVEKGMAKMCNPPQLPRLVSFNDLATLWDGRALFVSDTPVDTAAIMAPDRQRYLYYAVFSVLVYLVIYFAKRICQPAVSKLPRRWLLWLTVGEAATLGLIALLCGGGYHFATEGGLLANATATTSLQKGHAADFIPKISKERVKKMLNTDAVIIDARLARDYEGGHLPHAISLPVDANDVRWKKTLTQIPADRPLLVYCQSSGCPYAKNVSLRLLDDGYTGISIYRGGWADWSKGQMQRPDNRSSKRR